MKKLLWPFLAVILAASFLSAMNFYLYCITPCKAIPSEVSFNIPKGSTLKKTSIILEGKGIIGGKFQFKLLAKLKNAEHRIKSGEYSVQLPMSPLAILDKLIRGEVITYSITIPEGSTVFNIAGIIENAGLGTAESILKKAADISFIKSLGLEDQSLEGFLFPDTYRFSKGTTPEVIIKSMLARFKEVFLQALKDKPLDTGLSEKEILIFASLVEKETALLSEKPVVAAVFINRLKKRMRLECDPTVIYGIKLINPEFNSRLRKKHLQERTPYNTYRIYGLPPGPICNPGLESIKAAVNPAKVDYLYFVSKNDGTHKFSKTLKEHTRAVITYQKSR